LKSKVLFIVLFVIIITQLYGFGSREEDTIQTQNNVWTFAITNFDTSGLSADHDNIVNRIKREMVDRLDAIQYRIRISAEYIYYEELALVQARTAASRTIAARMDARSQLVFQGEPNWRFRRNIQRIDNELITLRANLEELENNPPIVNRQPVFNLTSGNRNFVFPEPPSEGTEARFCSSLNIDGFLTGKITDFHGRYFLSLRLYTLFTRSFVWEDSIIFSLNDINEAIDELTQGLVLVLSGSNPATVIVRTEPQDALVLVNRAFAGIGGTDIIEMQPQTITVTASAPYHESITLEAELFQDELTIINLSLAPVRFVEVDIGADFEGRIYHGALYVGQPPLTLRLPVGQFEFIEFESDDRVGSVVFQTPENPHVPVAISIDTRIPPPSGTVDRERRRFYTAWGITWLTGIAAWLANYTFQETNNAFIHSPTEELRRRNDLAFTVSLGTYVAVGAAAVYTIFRGFRYIRAANRPSTPVTTPSTSVRGSEQ